MEFLDIWDLVQEVMLRPEVDDEDETIQHILCTCVFSRQFWHQLLRRFGLSDLAPQSTSAGFYDWWQQASGMFNKEAGQGFNSLMRNDIVFNGALPKMDQVLLLAQDEADHWMLAGAKGLSSLAAARSDG
ncbi:hypothetical protein SETIT_9G580700v2 [Setaria italica]|uniref:Uncharacterized protein n=1 Tax=Setaria italica TaxID=4555 RepID=A0A368SXA9_SETIT|nr:hypothetical protein SETIT_9G580700v2 [Setaria italica]